MAKLPRRFAVAGIAIGIGLLTFWVCADKYNLFHLPTSEQVSKTHASYKAPPIFGFSEKQRCGYVLAWFWAS